MEKEEYSRVFQLEDRHWWYVGMRKIASALLNKYFADRDDLNILDVGCGTGGNLKWLARYGKARGVDISPHALGFCRQNEQRIMRATALALPFKEEGFDLVTCFDVLYHQRVTDDLLAMTEIHRVLTQDGIALLRVPAYEFLRGAHDEVVHTRHRYTATELRDKMERSGFRLERLTYANTLLLPLAAAKRLLERTRLLRGGGSDVRLLPPLFGNSFRWLLLLESLLVRYIDLPFGLSVFCLARKS